MVMTMMMPWYHGPAETPPFRDRAHAGAVLAEKVRAIVNIDEPPVVLALPRGGVVVGYHVAVALHVPLDVLLVCKIGAPNQPELALGAVVDTRPTPQAIWNEHLLQTVRLPDGYQQQELQRQIDHINRQRASYDRALSSHVRPDITGRTVVVVDDGIATSASIRAAVKGLRAAGTARSIILAVPVAPAEVIADLASLVDGIVCPCAPPRLRAVSLGYGDFKQTSDAEVIEFLKRCGGEINSG